MSKDHGCMMSEKDAVALFEVEVADAVSQCGVDADCYERALNRVRFRFDQCIPVKPKFFKGKYGKKYDSYSCGNCGAGGVQPHWRYCPNCGYAIDWRDRI